MADWDEDSPQLRDNLKRLIVRVRNEARGRAAPSIELARSWHIEMTKGLVVPSDAYVGRFRGEAGLEDCHVVVGAFEGIDPLRVKSELAAFEAVLRRSCAALDAKARPQLDPETLVAAVKLSAWVHCEWVRIHPFAKGNGRTARLWANFIAMRCGIPPFVRLRPRPGDGYRAAAAAAMTGDTSPTELLFWRYLLDRLGS